MRSHRDVIRDAGGVTAFARKLALPADKVPAVRQWRARGSIPPEYWPLVASEGLASLGELNIAHAARKQGLRGKAA
jgi:hypothetical protein